MIAAVRVYKLLLDLLLPVINLDFPFPRLQLAHTRLHAHPPLLLTVLLIFVIFVGRVFTIISPIFLFENGIHDLFVSKGLRNVHAQHVGQLHKFVLQDDCPGVNLLDLQFRLLLQPIQFITIDLSLLINQVPQLLIQRRQPLNLLYILRIT